MSRRPAPLGEREETGAKQKGQVAVTDGLHVYRLRVRGVASDLLRVAFDDVALSEQSGQTVMRTGWVDTAALFGLIGRIESMGLVLLEAKAVAGDGSDPTKETEHPHRERSTKRIGDHPHDRQH